VGALFLQLSYQEAGDLPLCAPSFTPLNTSIFDFVETCPRNAYIK